MARHTHSPTRRDLLRQAMTLLGSAMVPTSLVAQDALLPTVALSARMSALAGPNGNVLACDSGDGVILVDGGHASWADALLATVERLHPGKPVRALFNTHWHEEQTGANRALGERGVIVAHENTTLWLGTEVWVRWSNRKYPPLPNAAQPTTSVYDPGRMTIGGRVIEHGWARDAHTDGDLFLFFPDENVLVAGGFVSNAGWPIIDWWTGGWSVGMLNGFDRLLEVANERTRILPAVGPVMSLAELKAQHAMYLTVFERIHGLLIKALGVDEVLAAKPTAEFDAQFGDPTQFVTLAFESTWGHLRDAHDTRLRNIA
jgi:glyoxylase-like metal-dependent hydrolase (beta-lactamase superfamily II)